MKQNIYRRILAYVMIISILLPIATEFVKIPAVATESASTQTTETVSVEELTRGTQILRHIDEKVLSANQHVLRLPAEEALSSYAFLNRDGSMTVYYLDKAVKFRDQSGEIVEKDIRLTKTLSGFKTITNDVGLLLPDDPAKGISLSYGGYEITLVPEGGALRKTAQMDEEFVTYPNYFGSGASLKYTPALDGLKEDIVLSHYSGINSFAFRLYTDGLRMYQKNGRYYLAKSADGEVRFNLGDVVAFDARGRVSVGSMTVQTVTMGQEYVLTLSVDEAFLTAASTTYPVSVDPTLTVSDTNNGAGAIEDITLYSGAPNANCDWPYLHCGYYDSTYKVARTMFRLKGLLLDDTYQNIAVEDITSVKFYIKEATGTAAAPIHLCANTGVATWTETGATWRNSGHVVGDQYATASPGINQTASYDITNLVRAWKEGEESADAGFLLVNPNEINLDKAFYSSETATTSRRPYVVVEYNAGASFDGAISIGYSQTVPVNIIAAGQRRYFKFTPYSDGFHSFYSESSTGNPEMWLYNCNRVELEASDNRAPDQNEFGLTYHLTKDKVYYIVVGHNDTAVGSYDFVVTSRARTEYLKTSTASIGEAYSVPANLAYERTCFVLDVPTDGIYHFYSRGVTGDAVMWIYNSSLSLVTYNDNSGENGELHLEVYLAADVRYYIVIGHTGLATGTICFVPLMPTSVVEYIYNIKNVESGLIMDIQNSSAEAKAEQNTMHSNAQGRWKIKQEAGGTYTIQSQYGNEYYLGVSNSEVGQDNVELFATDSTYTRWNIYETPEHTLLFEPITALGKVLYTPDANAGTKLQLVWLDLSDEKSQWWIGGYNAIDEYHVRFKTVAIQCIAVDNAWMELIEAAAEEWNNSDAGVHIRFTNEESSYTLKIIENSSYLDAARTKPLLTEGDILRYATIELNSYHLDIEDTSRRQEIISTIAHEFGHLFGLSDFEKIPQEAVVCDDSLMSYGRNRNVTYTPRQFDIRNIHFIYE